MDAGLTGSSGLDIEPDSSGYLGFLERTHLTHIAPYDRDLALRFIPDKIAEATEPRPVDLVSLTRIFSPHLEQSQLLYTFSSSIAPQQKTTLPVEFRNHGRWLSHMANLIGDNHLLDTAVRAVSLAHLGLRHQSETFLNESRPYYGKALRLLNAALRDVDQGMAAETLSATILLSFYEVFMSNENESWVRHAGGAGTLMRIRGPDRHRHGWDREIFLAYRHTLVVEAFRHGTPCFLGEPEWQQLNRDILEDIKQSSILSERVAVFDAHHRFFQEFASIPETIHDMNNMIQTAARTRKNVREVRDNIVRRLQTHRVSLKGIFAQFEAALRQNGCARERYMSGDPVIPIYYDYPNIWAASAHVGHWTMSIFLNRLLIEFDPVPDNHGMYSMESREAALECCRSEGFMENSSFVGPFYATFGLRLCATILERVEERQWVWARLRRIGQRRISMANHVPARPEETALGAMRAAALQFRQVLQEEGIQ